ncbi:YdaU family protein [Leeia sp.]|uniref:YdaU family protein n=1 Tax=Leeia sp. TaxID=2884678 RepID=UPI0035B252A7
MSKKTDIWMPLYVGDYLADTTHLSTAQHGAYLLLLMAAWRQGGRLPLQDSQLAAICRYSVRSWQRVKPVLLPFFRQEGDSLVQPRLLAEWERAEAIAEKNRQNGRKGGRPRKQPLAVDSLLARLAALPDQTNPALNPDETPSPSQTHSPWGDSAPWTPLTRTA